MHEKLTEEEERKARKSLPHRNELLMHTNRAIQGRQGVNTRASVQWDHVLDDALNRVDASGRDDPHLRTVRFLGFEKEQEKEKEEVEKVVEERTQSQRVIQQAMRAGIINKESIIYARALYKRIDKNRQGTISRVQIARRLSDLGGEYVHPSELNTIFHDFHKDTIDANEFLVLLIENPDICHRLEQNQSSQKVLLKDPNHSATTSLSTPKKLESKCLVLCEAEDDPDALHSNTSGDFDDSFAVVPSTDDDSSLGTPPKQKEKQTGLFYDFFELFLCASSEDAKQKDKPTIKKKKSSSTDKNKHYSRLSDNSALVTPSLKGKKKKSQPTRRVQSTAGRLQTKPPESEHKSMKLDELKERLKRESQAFSESSSVPVDARSVERPKSRGIFTSRPASSKS